MDTPKYKINDRVVTISTDYDSEFGVVTDSFISADPYTGKESYAYDVILDSKVGDDVEVLIFAEAELDRTGKTVDELNSLLDEIVKL